MHNVLLTRQPIYNSDHKVIGYELLYSESTAPVDPADASRVSAARAILGTFLDVGPDRMVGSGLAFLDIPQTFLFDGSLIPMFEGQSVLELPADMTPSQTTLAAMKGLRDRGYFIALDHFQFTPEQLQFLDHVDYVKIDAGMFASDSLMTFMADIRGKPCSTIAINVDTHEMAGVCGKLGFDFFQGDFLCKPQFVEGDVLSSNKLVLLSLIDKLLDPGSHLEEVVEILSQDVPLTFKLLRYINSASFPGRSEVASVRDAVMLIGTDAVKNWASMILTSDMSSDKPSTIILTALIRARMCEGLAARHHRDIMSKMFITGLFSMLDAMLDRPMVDILDELSLVTPIRMALLNFEGECGDILQQVILYERGMWAELTEKVGNTDHLLPLYIDATAWAYSTHENILRSAS